MVLRGDVAAVGARVDARLVGATVAVLHLVRLAAGGEREQLVAEADAEDRLAGLAAVRRVEDGLELLDGLFALGRVTRAVAHKEAVVLLLGDVVVPRHEQQLDALGHEVADDVGLDAAVDGHDAHALARHVEPRLGVRDEELRLLARHLL
eukprot:scaffold32398_cov63-Phaeocystis_antarctica.AAC.3